MKRLIILLLLFVPSLRFTQAEDWDYMLFSQSWSETICRKWLEDNITTCAHSRVQDTWTIHGIWPTMSRTMGPEFCNQTWLYDPKEVQPLKTVLKQSWPNISKDTPEDYLWAHEWKKHGTCATDVEHFNSQRKYFTAGVEWLKKYTITSILSEANIVPSYAKTYTLDEIYNAVRSKIGVKPEIKCSSVEGKLHLSEVRLCFSRSVELIDCKTKPVWENENGIPSNCDLSGIIYLQKLK